MAGKKLSHEKTATLFCIASSTYVRVNSTLFVTDGDFPRKEFSVMRTDTAISGDFRVCRCGWCLSGHTHYTYMDDVNLRSSLASERAGVMFEVLLPEIRDDGRWKLKGSLNVNIK